MRGGSRLILCPVRYLALAAVIVLGGTGAAAHATSTRSPLPYSVAFWNAQNGVAALIDWGTCSGRSYFCKGAIAVTHDGGRTWKTTWRGSAVRSVTVVRGTTHAWAAVEPFESCTTSMASPCATRLVHSSDGGLTWRLGAKHLLTPSFVSERVGFAIRSRPGAEKMGPLMRTLDGGRTWRRLGGPCLGEKGAGLSFVSLRRGWALCTGQPGAGNQAKAVFETRNGGRTWRLVAHAYWTGSRGHGGLSLGGYPYGISFSAEGNGLLWQARGDTFSTRDGGRNWQRLEITDPEVAEVQAGYVVSASIRFLLLRTFEYQLLRSRGGGWQIVHRWDRR